MIVVVASFSMSLAYPQNIPEAIIISKTLGFFADFAVILVQCVSHALGL